MIVITYIATGSDNCVHKGAAKTETVSFEGEKWGWGSFVILGGEGVGGREGREGGRLIY